MKRHNFLAAVGILMVFTFFMSIFPLDTYAQERTGTVTGSVVNIRKGADTSYASVGRVYEGQQLTIIDEKDNWLQVQLADGSSGWIAGWLVKENYNKELAVVTGNVVNVREGAGIGYAKIGQVKAGEIVTILAAQSDWYRVQLADGTQGWLASWLVSKDGDQNSNTENSNLENGEKGSIKGNLVMVREEPSSSSSLLFQLKKGTEVVIQETKDNWYYIDSSQGSGWVGSWLVTLNNTTVSREGEKDSDITLNGKFVGKTIVIDPGHGSIQPGGWVDPGAIGRTLGVKERDINLDIALQLQQLLTQQGARVIMTHTTGTTYLSLAGRADIANSINADIFVSIHCNSNNNSAIAGTSVYYYAPSSNSLLASQRWLRSTLASAVQSEVVKAAGRNNIGVLEANFAVLRETKVPSILVETAFLSNPEEERLLNSKDFRGKIAWGIYKGIEKYFNNI